MKLIIPQNNDIYIVQKNDTLYSIANKYNTTVNELVKLNKLQNYTLKIGQKLNIPITNINNYIMYTIKKNDTLYSIANKYNTTVQNLIDINNLINSNLMIGQIIKVPINNNVQNNNIKYTVKKNDTLYTIANMYGMTVSELKKLNNLITDNIYVGQELTINSDYVSDISMGSSCYGDGFPQEIEYITYKVKKGDNLYNISKNYNVSVESIKELNNLKNNNLEIGEILKIKEKE